MNTVNTVNTNTNHAERNAQAKINQIEALIRCAEIDFDALGRLRDAYADRPRFVAGSNAPGCLPDSDPDEFTEFSDAKRAVIDDMLDDADRAETEELAEDLTAAAEDVNLESIPFCLTVGGRAYWVAAAEDDAGQFEELHELEATLAAADLTHAADADDVYDAIQALPLSIEVRSGWHAFGAELEAAEVRVILTLGGPSCEVRADFDPRTGCSRPRVLWADWGAHGEIVDFNEAAVNQFLDYLIQV